MLYLIVKYKFYIISLVNLVFVFKDVEALICLFYEIIVYTRLKFD